MSTTIRILVLASLLTIASFATVWTNAAYNLATWGWTVSGTLGDATFLPFPTPPRGVLLMVIVAMNPTDEFIYSHLLKTGVLSAVCVSLWILAIIYAFAAFHKLLKNPRPALTRADQEVVDGTRRIHHQQLNTHCKQP